MSPLDKITAILNELNIPQDKLIEIKTQLLLMSISEYERGAFTTLKLVKEVNNVTAELGNQSNSGWEKDHFGDTPAHEYPPA